MKTLCTGLLAGTFASALLLPMSPVVFGADGVLPAAAIPAKGNMDFSQVLPANVAGLLAVDNVFRFVNADMQTPAARLFNSPAVQMLLKDNSITTAELPSQKELEDIFGLTAKDLPRLFSGKIVLAGILTDEEPAKEGGVSVVAQGAAAGDAKVVAKVNKGLSVLALIEFSGSAAEFDRLTGKLRDEVKKKHPGSNVIQEQTGGITLYTVELVKGAAADEEEDGDEKAAPKPEAKDANGIAPDKIEKIFITLTNGTLVISEKKELLMDSVKALARGVTTNPLSGDSEFIAVKKEIGANDGYFMINLGSITRDMREQMQAGLTNMITTNPAAKQFIDPQTFLNAIALENFSAFYGSVRMDDQKLDIRGGLTWKERVGLATLINFGRQAVSVPRFVSTDYKGLDVSTVDFPASWDAFRTLTQKASPAAWPMMTMLIAAQPEVSKNLEAFRKGLMDNIEPGYIQLTGYATATPTDSEEPGKAFLIKVKDATLAQDTIDSILNPKKQPDGAAAVKEKLETKEYLGVKIYQTPELPFPINAKVKGAKNPDEAGEDAEPAALEPQSARLSYAFLDSYLIIAVGSNGMIEGVIANMKNPGKPLATDQFLDAIGNLPGTECGIGYADIATGVKAGLNAAILNGKTGVEEEDLMKARSACKDLHFFYASKSYFNDKGFYVRMIVAEDEKQKAAGK